jgi:hypothetical protein
MKNILILLLISSAAFSQPNKTGIDSVTLKDELVNWSKGVPVIKGSQNLRYYSDKKTYLSIGAATGAANYGSYNLVMGDHAGDSLNGGSYNTFFGRGAGQSTKTGNFNFAASWDALRDNVSGNNNVAIVEDALRSNIRGSNNIALGNGSQFSNTGGGHNISAGNQSLYYLTSGSENVAIGGYAGAFLEKGSGNVFISAYAGEFNGAAVGKTINDAIYIGRLSGISSAHSNSINIGYNTQSKEDYGINIGNVYGGNSLTGVAEVKAISISGRTITFDDNYMYVKTSTGVVKKVALDEITAPATSRVVEYANYYNAAGQLIFREKVYKR